LLTFTSYYAQSNRKLKIYGDQAFAEKDWFGAAQYYSRLYARDSSDINLQYQFAEASRLNFDNDIAIRLYLKVISNDEKYKFPLCYYWLGQLYKQQGNYKDAKKQFTKFSKTKKKKIKLNIDYYLKKCVIELEACNWAPLAIKMPVIPKPEHLDTNINSKVSEYAAFEMDSTLYFSSLRVKNKNDVNEIAFNKIYTSEIKNTKWQKPQLLDTNINSTYLHNANTCFTNDYKRMIVSKCKSKNESEFTCELFESDNINGKWTELKSLPNPINLKGYNTTQPSFAVFNNKTTLFFASNRPGGQGNLDIWYIYLNTDGSFENPVNTGSLINTPDDEITPLYVAERKQLFFSSTYHKGLGGFDIFKSAYNDSTFEAPENVGYPINSSFNDIYYSVNKAKNRAYISSNRIGSYFEHKLNCCNDIYRFDIDPLTQPPKPIDTLLVKKTELKLLVPLTLYFHNDEPEPKTKLVVTTKNYQTTYVDYKKLVPDYEKYYLAGLTPELKEKALEHLTDFFTDSVDAGMNALTKFSELLESVLLKNETVKITMKGYCSPLASTDYNINLAKRRISSLRNYFTEYKNGWFKKYINNQTNGEGKIIFEDVDIGELVASKVSDDLKDKRNSVYSPFAAMERKIQIIAISFGVE
jgi:hypothetical protein